MVLQAAENLVAEEGAKALTMRNIALEIGYTVGSIYMVFANMSDLILHLNARTLDAMIARIDALPAQDPAPTIEAIAEVYLTFAEQHYHCWRLIFEHQLAQPEEPPVWYCDKIAQAFVRFEAAFGALAETRSEAEAKQAARALWGGIHGICMLSLNCKFAAAGAGDMAASVRLLVGHFLEGWRREG